MALNTFTPKTWVPTTVGHNVITLWDKSWGLLSAQKPWSLTFPDDVTIRTEVRPGDTYKWDGDNADAANRSEVQLQKPDGTDLVIPNGTPFMVEFDLMVEPGQVNSSYFCALMQFHQDTDLNGAPWGPICDLALASQSDVPTFDLKYSGVDGQPISVNAFTDVAPLVRGQVYHYEIKCCADPTGKAGRLVVTRDGVRLFDYSGPLGYASSTGGYVKLGVYRGANKTQTMAVHHSRFMIFTGDKVQFPSLTSFIPAPALTVSVTAADADGTCGALLAATPVNGLSASYYVDGKELLGTTAMLSPGRHELWATFHNGVLLTGRYGPPCPHQIVEIGTAASIAASISVLATTPYLAAIVLTDKQELPATTAQDAVLQAHNRPALNVIQGTFVIRLSQTVDGKSDYDRQDQIFDDIQKLIRRERYKAGVLVWSQVV